MEDSKFSYTPSLIASFILLILAVALLYLNIINSTISYSLIGLSIIIDIIATIKYLKHTKKNN